MADGVSLICEQPDCTFITMDRTAMNDHFRECIIKPGNKYDCVACIFVPSSYDDVLEHAKYAHMKKAPSKSNDDFEDSGSDADCGKESSESDGSSGVDETNEKVDDGSAADDYADDDDDDGGGRGQTNKRWRRNREKYKEIINAGPDRSGLFSRTTPTDEFIYSFRRYAS